jgi:hypothetical protein
MHELHFEKAIQFHKTYAALPSTVKDEKIRDLAIAFAANVDRVVAMLRLAPYIAGVSKRVGFHLPPLAEILSRASDLNAPEVVEAGRKLAALYNSTQEVIRKTDEEDGYLSLAFFASTLPVVIRPGIEAILEAQIVAVWGAFETLAGDLWVECVNQRPRLGFIALGTEPKSEDPEEHSKQIKKKYAFTVEKLRDPNIGTKMGTLLRDDRTKFTRLAWIFDAYCTVFGDEPKISDALDGKKLKQLSALRNVLVHKAGFVDDEFWQKARGHARLEQFEKGKRIAVDGNLCAEFCGEGVRCSVGLIKFADDWLEANKV